MFGNFQVLPNSHTTPLHHEDLERKEWTRSKAQLHHSHTREKQVIKRRECPGAQGQQKFRSKTSGNEILTGRVEKGPRMVDGPAQKA